MSPANKTRTRVHPPLESQTVEGVVWSSVAARDDRLVPVVCWGPETVDAAVASDQFAGRHFTRLAVVETVVNCVAAVKQRR